MSKGKPYIIIFFITLIMGCQGVDQAEDDYPIDSHGDRDSFFSQQTPSQDAAEQKIKKQLFSMRRLQARWRNPFLTLGEADFFKQEVTDMIDYLNVSGIFCSDNQSYAIIDGRIVREKDTIDNKKVVVINAQGIILEDSYDRKYMIKMKGLRAR